VCVPAKCIDDDTVSSFDRNQVQGFDELQAGNPSVLRVGSTYHMYYAGLNTTNHRNIGHATSSDGVTWVKDAANPVLSPTSAAWDGVAVHTPCVLYNPSWPQPWKMWYSGREHMLGAYRIGYATSSDSVTWAKYAGNPVLGTGSIWERGFFP